jgi:hypothetical protein
MEASIIAFSINSKILKKVPHGKATFDLRILYQRDDAFALYFTEK